MNVNVTKTNLLCLSFSPFVSFSLDSTKTTERMKKTGSKLRTFSLVTKDNGKTVGEENKDGDKKRNNKRGRERKMSLKIEEEMRIKYKTVWVQFSALTIVSLSLI